VTTAVHVRKESLLRGNGRTAAITVVSGCVVLAARPALVDATTRPTPVLVGLFVTLLAIGTAWPRIRHQEARLPVGTVVVVGVTAFALGRLAGGGLAPKTTAGLIAANSLAAVAEEAWFRRLCYDLLLDAGPVWAIVGSSVLFAVVHVGVYGAWVLPLDLAAGLILGWQRWATGSWHASAVTHVVANLLVVI
jgi:membrane protease YdiL (CAAX protease family)